MILFIKLIAAVIVLLILCIFIDLINNLRGKPSHYAEGLTMILEGGQWLCIGAGFVLIFLAALFICGVLLFM